MAESVHDLVYYPTLQWGVVLFFKLDFDQKVHASQASLPISFTFFVFFPIIIVVVVAVAVIKFSYL